jgi:RNA polymerase-binding transcription factor DksA
MDTSVYKTTLEALYTDIVSELSDIAVHNPTTDDWEVKMPELNEADESLQADAAEDADERIAELDALETRYRSITRALAKVEAGTFGVCEISGEPIEVDRLAVNPAARTCKAHMDQEAELPM